MNILNKNEYECAVERSSNGKIHTVFFTVKGETLAEALADGSNIIRAHILDNYKPWLTVIHPKSNMLTELDDSTDDYKKFLKFAKRIMEEN